VRDRQNRLFGGWSADFADMSAIASGASSTGAPGAADSARASYSWSDIFGKLGVQRLARDKAAAPAVSRK